MSARMIIGWLVVGGFLIVFADIPATSELAVAFAYLILIAALLNGGAEAFNNLTSLIERPTEAK